MSKQKPPEMSDEMWAAVCIVMEDQQISSYKELTESNKAVIERMDQMETKWSEKAVEKEQSGAAGNGGTGDGGQPGGQGAGQGDPQGVTPPPVVGDGGGSGGSSSGSGDEDGDGEKGSGRGGKKRWHERDAWAR